MIFSIAVFTYTNKTKQSSCVLVNQYHCYLGYIIINRTSIDSFVNLIPVFLRPLKVKVSPIYDPYVRECLFQSEFVLSHRLCEVGWPVPYLAAIIPPMFPPGPHSLPGRQ